MDPRRVDAWARHFDTLLWSITGFLTAANVALLIQVVNNFNRWEALLGLVLIFAAACFAASFREQRHKVQLLMDQETKSLLFERRRFRQWSVFTLVFISEIAVWIVTLFQNEPQLGWVWILLGIFAILPIAYWWRELDKPRPPGGPG